MPRFLIKHVGNMGDLVFFVPPVLAMLKKKYPACHLTFVTAWGYKENSWTFNWSQKDSGGLPRVARQAKWGNRNQGGFSLHLMMTNPHIDELVHWHDTKLSLNKTICEEDGQRFATWSSEYYQQQKSSGNFDDVFELDFGLKMNDNPIKKIYQTVGLANETFSNYQLYLTEHDLQVARQIMQDAPRPRLVLLEGLASTTTRGWDPSKAASLATAITERYGVAPLWFGAKHVPTFEGRPLSLRENIATLSLCDVGLGVLSGPLHFAAAVGLPTLTLYCDQPLHRAAPAYFLNPHVTKATKKHRTLLGPSPGTMTMLKSPQPATQLTPAQRASQHYQDWGKPGRQSTKSCLAVFTVEEVMSVLQEMI